MFDIHQFTHNRQWLRNKIKQQGFEWKQIIIIVIIIASQLMKTERTIQLSYNRTCLSNAHTYFSTLFLNPILNYNCCLASFFSFSKSRAPLAANEPMTY